MKPEMRKEESENVGMAITLDRLHASMPALGEIAGISMKPKAAIKLGKIIRRVNEAVAENEAARIALCEKHGVKNEETQNYEIRAEERPEFDAKINELREKLICFPQHPIRAEDLGSALVSPDAMIALDWLFV